MKRFLLWGGLVLLAACGADPTPFPVDVPITPRIMAPATQAPPVRYALAPNMDGFVPIDALPPDRVEIQVIRQSLAPEQLEQQADLLLAYGIFEGWNLLSDPMQVALIVNPEAPPLTPALAEMLSQVMDATAVTASLFIPGIEVISDMPSVRPGEVRMFMANQGRPDGVQIVLAHNYIPGAQQIAAQLAAVNVSVRLDAVSDAEIRQGLASGQIHAALVRLGAPEDVTSWQTQPNEFSVRVLYTLPVSYLALRELSISITPDGFPLASW